MLTLNVHKLLQPLIQLYLLNSPMNHTSPFRSSSSLSSKILIQEKSSIEYISFARVVIFSSEKQIFLNSLSSVLSRSYAATSNLFHHLALIRNSLSISPNTYYIFFIRYISCLPQLHRPTLYVYQTVPIPPNQNCQGY